MELRHIRYFIAVAEELHFRRAAERCLVAQPAMSKQISSLEQELGLRLLHRTKRRVEITDAGRLFLEQAYTIVGQVEQAERLAAQIARGMRGRLIVGFTGTTLYSILPPAIQRFQLEHPEVELRMQELCTRTTVEALQHRQIHVGLLHPPITAAGIAIESLTADALFVALPEHHHLATRERIWLGELSTERFILPPRDIAPAWHDQMSVACRRAGVQPVVIHEVESPHTAVGLVAAGMGVALVWEALQQLQRPGVVYRPLDGPEVALETAVAWRSDNRSALVDAFLAAVRPAIRM